MTHASVSRMVDAKARVKMQQKEVEVVGVRDVTMFVKCEDVMSEAIGEVDVKI